MEVTNYGSNKSWRSQIVKRDWLRQRQKMSPVQTHNAQTCDVSFIRVRRMLSAVWKSIPQNSQFIFDIVIPEKLPISNTNLKMVTNYFHQNTFKNSYLQYVNNAYKFKVIHLCDREIVCLCRSRPNIFVQVSEAFRRPLL